MKCCEKSIAPYADRLPDFVPFLWMFSVEKHALNYGSTMLVQTIKEMLPSCSVGQLVTAFDLLIDVFLYRDEGADFAAGECGPRRAAAGHMWEKFVFQLCSSEPGE